MSVEIMSVKVEELDVKPSISSVNEAADANNYDIIFPSLPVPTGTNITVSDAWNNQDSRLTVRRHQMTTQVFQVPVEERRYKDVATFGNETNKKCEDIATRYGVKIEVCCSKDQSLHIVITGHEERVIEAKRQIVSELQTERDHKVRVPKEQHKFLIGKSGSVLKELQEKTCTSIQVPKPDANSDIITITGPKDGIEQAIHEIQLICDEQSKSGFERLNIPKLYHPWIRGVNGEVMADIIARTGAKINIPPPHIDKDEIAVSGEREKVDAACAELRKIYNEKAKLNITKLSIQIPKTQHKLIIGKNGSIVQEIFRDSDVYVHVPKSDSNSDTIYLYGEDAKLGTALSQVCARANSQVNISIDAPSWLHRYMIGEKGANISKITADFQSTHVKFEANNTILIDGPPDEVEKVKERLLNITNELKRSMSCEEVNFDAKFYQQIINKKYDNVTRMNKEYGVQTRLLPEAGPANQLRIEGPPDGVQKAKAEFLELLKRLENERSKDIIIEQKYHSNLIGKSGKNLTEIRSKFNDVQINIPSVEEKSDVVTIRGNKTDVEKCFKHLQQVIKDMQENNYQEEIHIFKEFHRMIIGKQGAFIRKIRDDTQVRIEVPAEDSDSDSIAIIGKQENVLKARRLIEEKVKELIKIEEDSVELPHALHTVLIGKGGTIIKQIRQECGGVIINFPPGNNPSDKITLKGPRADIEKAKKELIKLAKEKNDMSYTDEVHAKLEYHRFLVGRQGSNINLYRDKYNVRIIFPSSSSSSSSNGYLTNGGNKDSNNNKSAQQTQQPNDVITIIGKEENVKAVKAELEAKVKSLEEETNDEVQVDPKWHKNFTAKRAKLIAKISDENCNVKISFPKANTSNVVSLKGPKEAVEAAKKKILEAVYEMENQVTVEVPIQQKYLHIIIGKGGSNSQQISDTYHVELQFPAKVDSSDSKAKANTANGGGNDNHHNNNNNSNNGVNNDDDDDATNGSSNVSSPSKCDIVYVTGLREDCEKARDAMLALLPVREELAFPQVFHRDLLANKGEIVREIGDRYKVKINVPKREHEDANFVSIVGPKDIIETVKSELLEKLNEFELKNHRCEMTDIKPDLIPQLRGRDGKEAKKLEKKFDVRIEFSRKGDPDKIVIKGLQKNVDDCEAFIKKKIEDEEAKVVREIDIDSRIHSRIIGTQGKALAKTIDKFKVDIKFSGRAASNPNLVIVKGDNQDLVDDAVDYLKNLEDEYLQDVVDKEAYMHPSSKQNQENSGASNGPSKGFVVKGAPWEQSQNPNEPAPDTSNMEDFPTITSAVTGPGGSTQKMSWGPSRK